jgi:HEXXH motif-containing protein
VEAADAALVRDLIPDSTWTPPAPVAGAWYDALARAIGTWEPDPCLELDRGRIAARLTDACDGAEPWLYHPCASALTFASDGRQQQDFQLAVWTAAHSTASLGAVSAPRVLWAWARDGGAPVPAGRHDLDAIAAPVAAATAPGLTALDVWCDSIGFAHRHSWAASPPADPEAAAALEAQIVRFLQVLDLGERVLGDCMRWVATVTSVVVPLRGAPDDEFRSVSSPDLPGLVALDVKPAAILVLEALVHESAHHHLYRAEAAGPLVDPAHTGAYRSPLRRDPRPLRGILLAYHALVYIGALYADALDVGALDDEIGSDDVDHLQTLRDDAAITLLANRRHLTDAGNELLDTTMEVADRGRA